jgi:NAD(P)-dependent dehydrogenase (short-subunit alcohol dehydrogenase family)
MSTDTRTTRRTQHRSLERWRTKRWALTDAPRQDGRTAVITGANAGLGYQIALGLATIGAHVVMACRSTDKAEVAASRIRQQVPGTSVEVLQLDLASLDSVAAFVGELRASRQHLDVLVNNAGIMAVDKGRTADGFELQFGTNHLGHFALTTQLLPLLLATPGSRVSTMSSMGHRAGRLALDLNGNAHGYGRWRAYFESKLANLLFTSELHRRLTTAEATTIGVAAHPGASRTDLGTQGSSSSNHAMATLVPTLTQPAATGALPMLRSVTDPSVVGGEFYGPRLVWAGHPVRETPSRRARRAEDAHRLWEASERLTGITSPV